MIANCPCRIGPVSVGAGRLVLVAGPCLAESLDLCLRVADAVGGLCARLGVGYVFKSSFDKANRTALESARGPGLERGLEWLAQVRRKTGAPVLSDIHEPAQAAVAAAVLDCLQIPAFLCRQTDLLLAAGKAGKAVNVKKGQFVPPAKMRFAVEKIRSTGNADILLTERGSCFGYDLLVNDFRCVPIMREFAPVCFDATHSLQQAGGGDSTGGQRQYAPHLARAAMAAGADALFLETHPDPDRAASDAASQWPLAKMEDILKPCLDIFAVVRSLR